MKKYFKKKFVIPIIIAVVAILSLAGGVFAYNFFNGQANVEVLEAITWQYIGSGDPGVWDNSAGTWTVSLYPGETKVLHLQFNNASTALINVNPTVTVISAPSGWNVPPAVFTCDFVSDTYDVPGSGSCPANLQVMANTSAVPGTYTCSIVISR